MRDTLGKILRYIVKAIYPLISAKRRLVKRIKGIPGAKSYRLKTSGLPARAKSVDSRQYRNSPRTLNNKAKRYGSRKPAFSFFKQLSPRILIAGCAVIVLVIAAAVIFAISGNSQKAEEAMASQGPSAGTLATVSPSPSPDQSASPSPSPTDAAPVDPTTDTLKQGMSAPVVADIQQRLMDLNYMDDAEPTQLYGPATKQAVMLFQREENVAVDGCVGPSTYALLMAKDAPQYAVGVGDKGTDVKALKDRLYELGYLNASSSTFDTKTEAAVKKFQQLNGLSADGTIGENTMEMLYSDDVKANFISSGEKSDEVLACQKRLKALGYLTTTPDGSYGADTINAVKRFQSLNGLIADGYLGPETKKLLNSKSAQSNALTLGMSGSDITSIQQRLTALKYLNKATGYYGSATVSAVKAFQKQNKLTVDGKVGSQTMNVLMSSKAKAAPKTGGGGNSGGNSGGGSGSETGVDKLISVAESKLGCHYVRGAKGPSSFDCSGFVYWCLNHAGVTQSYMTSASWQKCTRYQRIEGMSNLRRGDIISFEGHVGIYMGSGEMINALPDSGVTISKNIMNSSYWTSHFVCGFRIF